MRLRWVFWIVVVVLGVALDQWSKRWALETLERGQTVLAWGGLLKLTLSFNQGAAFGLRLGAASRWIFIGFSAVVLVWLAWVYHRARVLGAVRATGIALVSAGAIGNLIDRIFWSRGVVDFLGPYDLGFMVWPIFNIADCWVVIGIGLLLLSMRHGSVVTGADAATPRSDPASPGVDS
jgi:signal peptidase II